MARGREGMEIRSMVCLFLEKRNMPKYEYDLKTVGGLSRGISYYSSELCKGWCVHGIEELNGAWKNYE